MACCSFVNQLDQFTDQCLKVQALFNNLLSSTDLQFDLGYLQSLRYEFGLDNDLVSLCFFFLNFHVLFTNIIDNERVFVTLEFAED